ncbi:ubiquinol-cytochrome-c reductase complex assembly factor 1 isoform X1 [Oryza brachyantha]|uniref:Ubiquinol-cytochrome c chaperone domain-containing protein n=1 Tax=Oryza brachyantha TaxID=4533 RepID=J3MKZ3_ORYBR|nr:ubiquinol-cytochrome-c reductase complex assembly factor 1 isoform X1 [Oryza brachyantha]
MSRWRAASARISAAAESRLLSRAFSEVGRTPAPQPPCRAFSKASAAAAASSRSPSAPATSATAGPRPEVRLNSMFLSKPCSLALPPDSPLRVEDPQFEGIKRFMLTLLLFYSKQSKSIRGANVVYHRITSQVDKSDIHDVFQLEKTFKTTFSLLVLHMWLILRRLKEEGKDGVKFGQYIYEIYNHDVELRVSKAGVNLLLTKWMKELEKIFYGNIVKYDTAISPEARQEDLVNVIWRNVYAEEGSEAMDAAAAPAIQALARYTRREATCLSLTDKEAMFSGNFKFTTLLPSAPSSSKPVR